MAKKGKKNRNVISVRNQKRKLIRVTKAIDAKYKDLGMKFVTDVISNPDLNEEMFIKEKEKLLLSWKNYINYQLKIHSKEFTLIQKEKLSKRMEVFLENAQF